MRIHHQLAVSTHEPQPRPGQREIRRPAAKLGHQGRAAHGEAVQP